MLQKKQTKASRLRKILVKVGNYLSYESPSKTTANRGFSEFNVLCENHIKFIVGKDNGVSFF